MEHRKTESLKPATSYTRIDDDGTPYLEGSKCQKCSTVFLGLREHCGRCGSRDSMHTIRLGDRGRLYDYTIVYRSYPGIQVPFISAIVDLDGGGVVKGNLLEVRPDPGSVRFDMPVKVVFRGAELSNADGAGYVAHFFIPDSESSHG